MGKYNHPRIGRIIMAQGRDAANTALTTSFGAMVLQQFKIWTTEAAACLSGLCCRLNHHFKHVFFVNEVRRTNLGILAEEHPSSRMWQRSMVAKRCHRVSQWLNQCHGIQAAPEAWKAFLRKADDAGDIPALRRATQTGRPPAGRWATFP
jgi:hypothetical protein